jgi:hypothetical protein
LLDLLERLRLKLPEGPHRFLGTRDVLELAVAPFQLVEHRRFLAIPTGPWRLARFVDSVSPWGLFHCLVLRKGPSPG